MEHCGAEDVRAQGDQPDGTGNVRLPGVEPQRPRRGDRGVRVEASIRPRVRRRRLATIFVTLREPGPTSARGVCSLPYARHHPKPGHVIPTDPTGTITVQEPSELPDCRRRFIAITTSIP